jgi:hypothetical protein
MRPYLVGWLASITFATPPTIFAAGSWGSLKINHHPAFISMFTDTCG